MGQIIPVFTHTFLSNDAGQPASCTARRSRFVQSNRSIYMAHSVPEWGTSEGRSSRILQESPKGLKSLLLKSGTGGWCLPWFCQGGRVNTDATGSVFVYDFVFPHTISYSSGLSSGHAPEPLQSIHAHTGTKPLRVHSQQFRRTFRSVDPALRGLEGLEDLPLFVPFFTGLIGR